MAIFGILNNAFVWINGIDLSNRVEQFALNLGAETPDRSAMGMTTRSMIGGIKTWDLAVTLQQDYNPSEVDATLFTLVGTTACFEVRPLNACTTQTNPSYWGIGVLSAYPVGGQFGQVLKSAIKMVNAGSITHASSS